MGERAVGMETTEGIKRVVVIEAAVVRERAEPAKTTVIEERRSGDMAKDPRVDWARKRNVPPPETEVEAILAERKSTHGDFALCAKVSQDILRALRQPGTRWDELSDVHVEALTLIAHKLHRVVVGDPNHVDHFRDIAGYATLVVKELEKKA